MPDLTVRVYSFSYRRGVPADPGEHGGGFVFDMRCLPNPGRLPAFATQTGADTAVAEWLEREPEVLSYREHVAALLDQAVETYRKRGFDSLSVGFGCTGGQHRSVYFAEWLTDRLRQRGVTVALHHREQPAISPSRSRLSR